jgi:hypothetical protein
MMVIGELGDVKRFRRAKHVAAYAGLTGVAVAALGAHRSSNEACAQRHRPAAERTVESLWDTCGKLLDRFQEHECRNYFRHCGYRYTKA